MSLFKSRKKFTVSERDPVYKVRYLGNVQTSMMRGDGCVDKPTAVLWNNFAKTTGAGLEMKLSISASGLKAITKEQGLTEYRAHRISYCIAHPKYPKLFVWVYRHEGKKLKVELRCHAVLCKTEAKAKAMAVQLHDKLASALAEFMREKCRRQSTRLALQRTNSLPLCTMSNGLNARNKFLSTGANFKPPVDRSASAPKLGCIAEDMEPEEVVEELDEEDAEDELDDDYVLVISSLQKNNIAGANVHGDDDDDDVDDDDDDNDDVLGSGAANGGMMPVPVTDSVFGLEVGNDVAELKKDSSVRYHLDHTESDDGDDSSESGFSEQDVRESSSSGSAFGSDPQLSAGTGNCPCPHPAERPQQDNDNSGAGGHNDDDDDDDDDDSGAHSGSPTGAECAECGQMTSEVTASPNISHLDRGRPAGANINKGEGRRQLPAGGMGAGGGPGGRTEAGRGPASRTEAGGAPASRTEAGTAAHYSRVIINERRL